MSKDPKPISREELRRVVEQCGGVERFAPLVPVRARTVWYWLSGRTMHPVFAARVRQLAETTRKEAT